MSQVLLAKVIGFLIASLGIVWVSRSSLRNPRSHGFYRFFAWEIILILFLRNVDYWFVEPFSLLHILSWACLFFALYLIYEGVQLFRQKGNLDQGREDPDLLGIEKTTALVTSGVYGYIRHPFYSSLLFLGWGIFFKKVTWLGLVLAVAVTIFLAITAKREENENLEFFGDEYGEYMQRTKRFIPFLF